MYPVGNEDVCPRCAARRLRLWSELTSEEREVARRLSAGDPEKSRWCARCWYEERDTRPRVA